MKTWFALGLLLVALGAARSQTVDMARIEGLLGSGDTAALRTLLQQEPPPESPQPLALHYGPLVALAGALGDTEAVLDVQRRWLRRDPSSLPARVGESRSLSELGLHEQAIDSSTALVRRGGQPHEQVRFGSYLAQDLVKVGRVAEAQTLLDDLKPVESFRQWDAFRFNDQQVYWAHFASAEYQRARCELAGRMQRWPAAEAACRKEIEHRQAARDTVGRLPDARLRAGNATGAVRDHLHARIRLAGVLAQALKAHSAERLIRELGAELQGSELAAQLSAALPAAHATRLQVGQAHLVPVYHALARIRFQQHRYAEAQPLVRQATTRALAGGPGRLGEAARAAIETQLLIGVAMGDWEGVDADLRAVDLRTGSTPGPTGASPAFALPRGLLALHRGAFVEAEALLAGHGEELRQALGDRHFRTALVTGLQALAGLRSGTEVDRHRIRLRHSVALLVDPATPGQDLSDAGENRVLLRQVMQAMLDNARVDQPAEVALAFQAADHLRANVTQRSIQAAAVRRAVADPALAAPIRQLQDRDALLQAAYERLSSLLARRVAFDDPAMAALRATILEAEAERSRLLESLRERQPAHARLMRPRLAEPAALARLLRPGEWFVSMLPAPAATTLWAIDATGHVVMARSALGQAELEGLVQRLRAQLDVAGLGGAAPRFDATVARQLHDSLLQPLRRAMPSQTAPAHLIVAVAGALTQLPMGVLVTSPPGQPNRFLIDEVAVTHVTSAGSWMQLKEADTATRQTADAFIGWGDPDFARQRPEKAAQAQPGRRVRATLATRSGDATGARALRYDEIPELPETRDELLAIASSLQARPSDLLLGAAATRASVLARDRSGELARKRVLAFATHGLVPGEVPDLDQPALALAQQSAEATEVLSNLLMLDDILGLRLQADWVLLSACNTASSDGASAEGISGLVRGFFYAGARSVLATHWAVESESALRITTATFSRYQADRSLSKAEALRQATLQVKGEAATAHPAFWAPFALIGDGAR